MTPDAPVCANCQRRKRLVWRGRCARCVSYYYKNDRTWPPQHALRPGPKARIPALCSRCRSEEAEGKSGLCEACYQYQRRTGRGRPRYLWRPACKICGKPAGARGWKDERCELCRLYRKRYGKDRSAEIVARYAPNGWCECGQPAVTDIPGDLGRIKLCAACAEIEQSMWR